MNGPFGIPYDELAMQRREAYESEGKAQCETCLEWKPAHEVKAHCGECQECWETTGVEDV